MQGWKFDTVQVTQRQTTISLLRVLLLATLFSLLQLFYNLTNEPDTVYAA